MPCKQTGNGIVIEVKSLEDENAQYVGVGCIYDVTPTGVEYETVVDEQCLNETGAPATDLGDAAADEVLFTHSFCPGGALTELLRDFANNKTNASWRIVYPANSSCTGGTVETFNGRIRIFKPSTVTKKEFMKLPITVLRDGPVNVSCVGAVANIAAMTALPIAGLTAGDGVLIGTSIWTWDPTVTFAATQSPGYPNTDEPDDKPNPGVDPGFWVERVATA